MSATQQMWIIVDLDGTLADIQHRLHFIKDGEKPNWDGFNAACVDDIKVHPVAQTVDLFRNFGAVKVCIMTGRSQRYIEETVDWLRSRKIPYDALVMRAQGDFRSDTEVKKEMYAQYFQNGFEQRRKVYFVLEDRDKVVAMWRELGLTCFQVRKGDY